MRLHWLLLSILGTFLFCSSARAEKLLFWRYESQQNRLIFNTDGGVQPRAQLLSNPTRLVIDLPGTTLGRPTIKESFGGKIRSLRVGQFDEKTARIVVELTPGYTLDPQAVKFRGLSPNQWVVDLPTPTLSPLPPRSSKPSVISTQSSQESLSLPTPSQTDKRSAPVEKNSPYIQVTRSGILLDIKGNRGNNIKIERSGDRRQLDLDLEGVTLPSELTSGAIALDAYGINTIQFSQTSSSPPAARITLDVSEDSPDWLATFSRLGGLVLVPRGGVSGLATANAPTTETREISLPNSGRATIESLELANNSELFIRADRDLTAEAHWNSDGVYEIRIPNAQLADPFPDPQLGLNSPISEIRIRQKDNDVLLLVRPAFGVRVSQLEQPENNLVALELQSSRTTPPRASANSSGAIDLIVPPPESNASIPPIAPLPSQAQPTSSSSLTPKQKLLVVIDPGHGGQDPGTIGIGGVQEKHIVLPIAQEVTKILEEQGIQVIITRSSDYFISLKGRTEQANRANADLFVSIHANAINLSRPDVNGLETYYYNSGRSLADTIHRNMLRSVNIRDRGVRRARFYVLRHSVMPAVLVEVGYLTGAEDAPRLQNATHRSQVAGAIARGIIEYVQQK